MPPVGSPAVPDRILEGDAGASGNAAGKAHKTWIGHHRVIAVPDLGAFFQYTLRRILIFKDIIGRSPFEDDGHIRIDAPGRYLCTSEPQLFLGGEGSHNIHVKAEAFQTVEGFDDRPRIPTGSQRPCPS